MATLPAMSARTRRRRAHGGVGMLAACTALAIACGGDRKERPATTAERAPIPEPAAESETPLPPGVMRPPKHVEGEELLDETKSEFSKIRVRQEGSLRALKFVSKNGSERHQTTMDVGEPHALDSPYAKAMFVSLLFKPGQDRVLILGLGGGAMVQFLRHHFPDMGIDAVELDPEVVRMAEKWFGVRSHGKTKIITADAFDFIADSKNQWDVIYMDTFLDPAMKGTDSSGVPMEMRTVEFLKQVEARVAEGGLVMFNLHFKSSYKDHLEGIRQVWDHVRVIEVSGTNNRVVIASQTAHPSDQELLERAEKLDGEADWGFSYAKILDGLMEPLPPPSAEPTPAASDSDTGSEPNPPEAPRLR